MTVWATQGMPDHQDTPLFIPRGRPTTTRKRAPRSGSDDDKEEVKVIRRDTVEDNDTPNKEGIDRLGYAFEGSGQVSVVQVAQKAATAASEYETAPEQDHRARREAAREIQEQSLSGQYFGRANYRQYIERRDTSRANALSDKNFRAGPQRISAHIRNTCRFDYAADLCKDYNETGFCGFGDSCKFIHDRGDYKSGWELELEWEERQRKILEGDDAEIDYKIQDSPPREDSGLSLLCPICGKVLAPPIIETVRCQHRFCEKCALAHSRVSPHCKVCGQIHNGAFKFISKV